MDQFVSAIKAELIFHVKLLNLAHIIYNILPQIGEKVIKLSENVPSQIPASFDHVALNRWKFGQEK